LRAAAKADRREGFPLAFGRAAGADLRILATLFGAQVLAGLPQRCLRGRNVRIGGKRAGDQIGYLARLPLTRAGLFR
jgi:hypothetical protein